jgi:peptide chain release factor 1
MQNLIEKIEAEYRMLTESLENVAALNDHKKLVAMSRRKSELDIILERVQRLRAIEAAMQSNAELTQSAEEAELRDMAMEENLALTLEKTALEAELKQLLLPKDKRDDNDIIMEIRGGAGGDESSLFATELFRMYSHYAEKQGWRIEMLPEPDRVKAKVVFEVNRGGARPRYTKNEV